MCYTVIKVIDARKRRSVRYEGVGFGFFAAALGQFGVGGQGDSEASSGGVGEADDPRIGYEF
jgi:hypothetical protein